MSDFSNQLRGSEGGSVIGRARSGHGLPAFTVSLAPAIFGVDGGGFRCYVNSQRSYLRKERMMYQALILVVVGIIVVQVGQHTREAW